MSETYRVDRERWFRFTILEQMGNIGAEVGRTFAALQRGDKDRALAAVVRALDLFEATAEGLAGKHSPRLREVLRAKEQYLQIAYDEPYDPEVAASLERYFMHFALAARTQHYRERQAAPDTPTP